jgi:hypothetical protein
MTNQKLYPGMELLVAGGEGGIELPSLFFNLLYPVHTTGQISIEEARKSIHDSHQHQFSRMDFLYKKAPDGVEACLRAVLGQMTLKGFLVQEDEVWKKGPKFDPVKRMVVVEGIGATMTGSKFKSEVDEVNTDVHALYYRLSTRGLRPTNPDHVLLLKKSIEDWGYLPGFPITLDQNGIVLSGRHRLKVAQDLGFTWASQVVKVNETQAVGIAAASNVQRPFTSAEYRDLESSGLGAGRQETTRRLITLALLENAQRSDNAISKLVGCHHQTVSLVRGELESNCQIDNYSERVEVNGRRARGQKPKSPQSLPHPKIDPEVVEKLLEEGKRPTEIGRTLGIGPSNSALTKTIARIEGKKEARTPPSSVFEPKGETPAEVPEICSCCGQPLPIKL